MSSATVASKTPSASLHYKMIMIMIIIIVEESLNFILKYNNIKTNMKEFCNYSLIKECQLYK